VVFVCTEVVAVEFQASQTLPRVLISMIFHLFGCNFVESDSSVQGIRTVVRAYHRGQYGQKSSASAFKRCTKFRRKKLAAATRGIASLADMEAFTSLGGVAPGSRTRGLGWKQQAQVPETSAKGLVPQENHRGMSSLII